MANPYSQENCPSKRVEVYNTKLSNRNTKKNFLHTNLFITQYIFEHSIQNHYF
jgi:hypothetical protein